MKIRKYTKKEAKYTIHKLQVFWRKKRWIILLLSEIIHFYKYPFIFFNQQ